MIWNMIPNSERLSLWKKLREDIEELLFYEQLQKIALFFSTAPFGSRTIDYYSPSDWPTPWEILFYGDFCASSISLLIFYTLFLLPGNKNIELILVNDNKDVYLLPLVEEYFVLNYELGKVNRISDIEKEFKILKKYSRDQVRKIT
jgi:hypothetical protein